MAIFPHYRFWLWPLPLLSLFSSALSFVTSLIKLGCSGGAEPVMHFKQNQPKIPKCFLIVFVSEWLRDCNALFHITFCREWLQDPSASGAWKFHIQFLFLLEYAARFAKIQKILCCFKKNPNYLKCKCIINRIKFSLVLKLNASYQTEYLKSFFDLKA